MKTLDRYITAVFLRNFGLATLALTSLFLFQKLLGELFERQYPSNQVIIYNLLHLPDILIQMTPPAVLLATVLTLSGLSRSNELTACFSIGIGLRRIAAVILAIVFMISCFVLIIEDRILPPTFRIRTTYYMRVMQNRPDFFLDIKQDKIWYRSKNLIYNLRTFDYKTQRITGMAVYTFDDGFNLMQVVDASHAEYRTNGWHLMDGTVTVFSKEDPFPLTQKFEEKDLPITETPRDFQEIEKEVDGLRLKELWAYIQRMKSAGADTKSYEVKFHSRISLSFIPVVMCILGIPFSTRGKREGGMAKDLGICLSFTFFYWLFYSIGLSLGINGALPPWLAAWLPSVVFVMLSAGLITRRRT